MESSKTSWAVILWRLLWPPARTPPARPDGLALLVGILGAEAWGTFIVMAPMELLCFSFLVWGPLGVLCEARRSRHHGLMPGFAIRAAVVLLVVVAAAAAPTKYMDQWVGPFSKHTLTAAELAVELPDVGLRFPEAQLSFALDVPQRRVRLSQLVATIEEQTGLTHRIGYCGNGASILWGGHPIAGISFRNER